MMNEDRLSGAIITKSRLSKNLQECLTDTNALKHLEKFLRTRGADHLVKFCIDQECFEAEFDSVTRLDRESGASGVKTTADTSSNVNNNCPSERSEPDGAPSELETVVSRDAEDMSAAEILASSIVSSLVRSCDQHVANVSLSCPHNNRKPSSNESTDEHPATTTSSQHHEPSTTSSVTPPHSSSPPPPSSSSVTAHPSQQRVCDHCKLLLAPSQETIDRTNAAIAQSPHRSCLALLTDWVCDLIERYFFPDFLSSHFYLSHQLDTLTKGQLSPADLALHPLTATVFTEYCDAQGLTSVLKFFLVATCFRNQLLLESSSNCDNISNHDQLRLEEAMSIYDRFISWQALDPLPNLDRAVRSEVEQGICGSSNDGGSTVIRADAFTPAVAWAERQLSSRISGFLKSDLFFQILRRSLRLLHDAQSGNNPGNHATSQHKPVARVAFSEMGEYSSSDIFETLSNASYGSTDHNHSTNRKKSKNNRFSASYGGSSSMRGAFDRRPSGSSKVDILGNYQTPLQPAPTDSSHGKSVANDVTTGRLSAKERLKCFFKKPPTQDQIDAANAEAEEILKGVLSLTQPELLMEKQFDINDDDDDDDRIIM